MMMVSGTEPGGARPAGTTMALAAYSAGQAACEVLYRLFDPTGERPCRP